MSFTLQALESDRPVCKSAWQRNCHIQDLRKGCGSFSFFARSFALTSPVKDWPPAPESRFLAGPLHCVARAGGSQAPCWPSAQVCSL